MPKKKKKKTVKLPGRSKKTAGEKVVKTKKIVKKPKKTQVKKIKKSSIPPRKSRMLKIKKELLAQRDELLREAEEALNILPGEINFPDMGDQATAETDRDFMLRLRDRERMLLKKIDEAVESIDKDTFGICENCGHEIGIKRLEARPVTTYCIDCKTRQEEEERIAEGG